MSNRHHDHMVDMWRLLSRCPHCRDGKVALLTSVGICNRCGGSGIERGPNLYRTPLVLLGLKVRTRKLLARRGILTLGQLAREAACGALEDFRHHDNSSCLTDALTLLRRFGLTDGDNRDADAGATQDHPPPQEPSP